MESLRASAMEREAAVAEERSFIARELHDSIAQSLAFMKIQVQLLRQAAQRGTRPRCGAPWRNSTRACASYADVRELLMHFRTRTSEQDIEPALRATLQKFEHQAGLSTRLTWTATASRWPPTCRCRCCTSCRKRCPTCASTPARGMWSCVQPSPHWRFEVSDDGAGFDPADPARAETHVGLRIMQERAQRIGAHVRVRSAPGAGCTVVLELPPAAPTPTRRLPRRRPDGEQHDVPFRLLVVDDHTLFRRGLVALLGADPTLRVVGEGMRPRPCARRRNCSQTWCCWTTTCPAPPASRRWAT